jgi:hypothetical protein
MREYKNSFPENELEVVSIEEAMEAQKVTNPQTPIQDNWYDAPSWWIGTWSNPYPAPIGYITTFGTQTPPKVSAQAATVVAWILVIGTDGAMSPIFYPLLVP